MRMFEITPLPSGGKLRYVWLIYLGFVVMPPALGGATPTQWLLTVGSLAIFAALYSLFHRFQARRPAIAFAAAVAIGVLGLAALRFNTGAVTYIIFSGALGALLLTRPGIALFVTVMLPALALVSWTLPPAYRMWVGWPAAITFVVITVANALVATQARQQKALLRAQEEVEEMAKLAERERIARDLHDLLGHTLSVIALKSELAAKLADHDLPGAVDEIRDVERVSREALGEVRRAVEGYRRHGLKGELQNAERALQAGGVAFEVEVAPVTLPPKKETVLALALREAVTNVVRHAGASRCRVHLNADGRTAVLTVQDDGRGELAGEGSGLAGMRARVAEAGGTLDVSVDRGVRLTVSLPVVEGGVA